MGNIMKNLILITDDKGSCIDSIIATGLYNIKLVVVPYKENIKYLKDKYNNKIENYVYYIPDTNDEFQKEFGSDYNLTYEEIEQYRDVQLKCYRYNLRYIYDDNANNNIYYTSLKFFLGFFKNNNIDCVFSRIMEHGAISDSLIFEIAKKNKIPTYILSMNTGFAGRNLASLICYNDKSFVNVADVKRKATNFNELLDSLNGNYSSNTVAKLPFSKMIKKLISKKDKTLISVIKWFYNYRIKYYIKNIKYSLIKDLYKIREETSLTEMLKGRLYLNKLKQYYRKSSIKQIEDKKYIFYPLHMEPEAAILARPTMNSQLFVIEQISNMLPEGYMLYVKEHPDQFAAVQLEKYFYKSMHYFRNIDFYKRLLRLRNVKLIDVYMPSSSLIDNAEAIVSIAGSALIESVAKKKTIIVWGNGSNFVELLQDSLKINGIKSLNDAIEIIKRGYTPQYNDFKYIVDTYIIPLNEKELYDINETIVDVMTLINEKN